MQFDLTPEQKMFHEAVRDFCQKEIAPYAMHADETGEMRWEAIRKMPAMGLTSMVVPEDYGGAALDPISVALAIEELGRACGSTGLSLAAHNGLGCFPIVQWGSEDLKKRFLPVLTDGHHLGALALTEPNAGSDLRAVKTTARREGDSWVINGHKAWITNPKFSPTIITHCRTENGDGSTSYNMIVVETDREGLHIEKPEKKMGLKASPTQQIRYENVKVPYENLLGKQDQGLHQVLQTLDGGRITIGALSVGLAQAAFEAAIKYAQQREAFGKPIANYQAIQWMLADAEVEIEASRLLVMKAAWLKSQGRDFAKAAAICKLKASEVAEKVCFAAIQIHGSYGYSAEFPVERIYRDQRLMTIGEGTSEIQRMVISRAVLKENPLR
jgi:alkylation response protein AidB-like acyl-CoA dehydrogenase